MIHPAMTFEFGRLVQEYARWHAINEEDRSLAPAWWWSPALGLRDAREPMPADWVRMMALPDGATYADASRVLLEALTPQNSLPWPEEFPHRYRPRFNDGSTT